MAAHGSVTVLKQEKSDGRKSTRFSRYYAAESSLMSTAESAEKDRMQNRRQFSFQTMAFLMSIQNFWRFPREAYLKGQGAFIWAYIILMFFVGSCMLFFEVALGQSINKGYTKIFSICPFFEGLSTAMGIYCMLVAIYYNVINMITFLYFLGSFDLYYGMCDPYDTKSFCVRGSANQTLSPEYAFFKYHIINNNSKNSTLFEINWRNSIVLLILWAVIAVAVLKTTNDLTWPNKLLCVLPFVTYGITLMVALSLKGAADGLRIMFHWPKEASDSTVWRHAMVEVIVSLGLGMGPIITFGSNLTFHTPSDRDSLCIVIFVGLFTVLSGTMLFSTAGILAEERSQNITTVLNENLTDLYVHVTFSQLFTRMGTSWSNVNAVLFFLTLFINGLYPLITYVQSAILMCYSHAPRLGEHRICTTLFFCLLCFSLGLVLLTPNGYKWIISLDKFLVSITLVVIVICEYFAVIYIYGIHDFSDDLIFMIGFEPNFYIKLIWIFSPCVLLAFFGMFFNTAVFLQESLYDQVCEILALLVVFTPLIFIGLHNLSGFYKEGNAMSVFSARVLSSDSDIDITGKSVPWFRRLDSRAGSSYAE